MQAPPRIGPRPKGFDPLLPSGEAEILARDVRGGGLGAYLAGRDLTGPTDWSMTWHP
jgi:hypothetical protein